ncbi:uncharacterized protein LOC134189062 [Corticium candelabrum]|uniref:uncharacterized protein LOC134189062 n=1 Tax=Corticium candelabrum TaxID=121492 RepID=UPI002E25D4C0|nr:uncharacterized protein LOC134189062 [Corticium candelabrum]
MSRALNDVSLYNVPEITHRRVLSIAQDIIYTAHNGRVKTSRQVLLPTAIHHITRSAQVVSLLNRFGHGISMSQIKEMDNALAEKQLELAGTGNVPLPSNVDLLTSVVLATDNNDIMEDTPTGSNTTHCTNSILIQRAVPTVAAMPYVYDQSQKRTHTRCDTVSSFSKRGKGGAFKLISSGHIQAMQRLGESLTLDEHLIQLFEEFVYKTYGKESFTNVNSLRYHLFCTATSKWYADLPPTRDAFVQHVRRSNYQAFLWKQCLQHGAVSGPIGHGWDIDDGDINVLWMTLPLAPLALLELLRCGCSSSCKCKECVNAAAAAPPVTDVYVEDDDLIVLYEM